MIGALGLSVGYRPAHRVGLELHVGIGEEQPVASGLLGCAPHCVSFSNPPGGQFIDADDLQNAERFLATRQATDNLAGSVGRAVVDGDDFVVVIVEGEKTEQCLLDVIFFVACRNDDADAWALTLSCSSIPLWAGDVSDTRNTQRRIRQAREPHDAQQTSCNPLEIDHSAADSTESGACLRTGGANRIP